MNKTKIVNESADSMMFFQSAWLVEKTVRFRDLKIMERAEICAPEGKRLTLVVNGVVQPIKPGRYQGEVALAVSDAYVTQPSALMSFNQIANLFRTALCFENGEGAKGKWIPEAIQGGAISDSGCDSLYIACADEDFNGVVVDGGSFSVRNTRMDFEGFGPNDFAGAGAGVATLGGSEVLIEDSEFNFSGVTRCAIHTGGDSRVTVRNCDITNFSPPSGWLGSFCWNIALRGTNRLCQLCDNGQVIYENCRLKTNGWGIVSIDGSDRFVKLTLKDSDLELSGPRAHGYGIFCIGPNEVDIDHSVLDVYGYPVFVMGMEKKGRVNVTNGSVLRGRRFGAMINGDDGSIVSISDTKIETGSACIVAKGSVTTINLDNVEMESREGILLRLMDTEECGMDMVKFFVPVGEKDEPVPGRDLYAAEDGEDIVLNMKDMDVSGDFLNSTTDIRAYKRAEKAGMCAFHDTLVGPVGFSGIREEEASEMGPPPSAHSYDDLHGPRNLGLNLKNTRITGVISSATQAYADGVTEITPENWFEMSKITQSAAPTVNNGVVVNIDGRSAWTVANTSYITALVIAEGGQVLAPDGMKLTMTVDGAETEIAAGSYKGAVVLTVA